MAQLDQAILLAPQILTYHLNLVLWSDTAAGDSTDLTYEALKLALDLPNSGVEAREDPSWLALAAGEVEDAAELFATQRNQQPMSPEAYLGSAVAAYLQNRPVEAQQRYKQAELLGIRDLFWGTLIADKGSLDEVLAQHQDSSTFGITTAGAEVYGRGLLNRRALQYDLLPSLNCFATTPLLHQNLQILLAFYKQKQSTSEITQIEKFLEGDMDGIRPCVTINL